VALPTAPVDSRHKLAYHRVLLVKLQDVDAGWLELWNLDDGALSHRAQLLA